jgi:hypothetical protein
MNLGWQTPSISLDKTYTNRRVDSLPVTFIVQIADEWCS